MSEQSVFEAFSEAADAGTPLDKFAEQAMQKSVHYAHELKHNVSHVTHELEHSMDESFDEIGDKFDDFAEQAKHVSNKAVLAYDKLIDELDEGVHDGLRMIEEFVDDFHENMNALTESLIEWGHAMTPTKQILIATQTVSIIGVAWLLSYSYRRVQQSLSQRRRPVDPELEDADS